MTPSDGFTGVSETENTIGQRAVEDLTPTINNPTDTKIDRGTEDHTYIRTSEFR